MLNGYTAPRAKVSWQPALGTRSRGNALRPDPPGLPFRALYTDNSEWFVLAGQREADGVSRCTRRGDASGRGLYETRLCGAHRDWYGCGKLNCSGASRAYAATAIKDSRYIYPSEATRHILRYGFIRQRIGHRQGLVRRKQSARLAMLPSATCRIFTTSEPPTPVFASHPRFAICPSGITQ